MSEVEFSIALYTVWKLQNEIANKCLEHDIAGYYESKQRHERPLNRERCKEMKKNTIPESRQSNEAPLVEKDNVHLQKQPAFEGHFCLLRAAFQTTSWKFITQMIAGSNSISSNLIGPQCGGGGERWGVGTGGGARKGVLGPTGHRDPQEEDQKKILLKGKNIEKTLAFARARVKLEPPMS